MAIDFPNSPTVNQTFTSGSKTWIWTGTQWQAYRGSAAVTLAGAETISNKTLGSDLAAGGFKVTGLGSPSASADAATKTYVDTAVAAAGVADGGVTTAKLADNAVTSAKIADGTIVDADISGTAAIAPSKVAGTAVITTDSRLSDARTPTSHATSHASAGSDPITIANTQVTGLGTSSTRDVAASGNASATQVVKGDDTRLTDQRTPLDNSVTSAKIVDGTIVNGDISASAAIALSKLATGSLPTGITVTGSNIVDLSVNTADLADGAVTSAKIADGTIVDADINASANIAQSKINGLSASLGAKADSSSPYFTGSATFAGSATFQSATATSFTTAPTTPNTVTLTAGSNGVTSIDVNNATITIVQDGRWTATLLALTAGTVVNPVIGGVPYSRPVSTVTDSSGTTTITLQYSTFQVSAATSIYWTGTPLTFVAAPAQTGNGGRFLTTDGTSASWAAPSVAADSSIVRPILTSPEETVTVSATAATGTVNFDARTSGVVLYTTSASGNWTLNVRGDGSNTLNSMLAVGSSITVAFLVTNGSTAYYQTAFQIDGAAQTVRWQGGTAPSSGNVNSVDVYTFTIIKTDANPTYTVLGQQTRFA